MPRRPSTVLEPASDEAIARRLLDTRKVLGFTTTEMCRRMGSASGGSAWTNYEMGRRKPSLDHALELCRRCLLTLDWIYRGDYSGLPPDIRDKLLALDAEHD